ncbi:hypothetical protein [Kineococcus sp. SYSU DK003]|uniref:hypothetical protein n=1 Tax=Kineococcus sp. SYSU DK003 TaxID=3383124 RepID=UPI003D7D6FBC
MAEWSRALSSVELDVRVAEQLLERLHSAEPPVEDDIRFTHWTDPGLIGPIPTQFAERARALLARQLDVSERLAEAVVHARAERRALAKLDPAERRPVFVDKAL